MVSPGLTPLYLPRRKLLRMESARRILELMFLTAWADNTEPRSAAAYVHFGMTSSDLLDTALAVQLVEASDVLLQQTTTAILGNGHVEGVALSDDTCIEADLVVVAAGIRPNVRAGSPSGG